MVQRGKNKDCSQYEGTTTTTTGTSYKYTSTEKKVVSRELNTFERRADTSCNHEEPGSKNFCNSAARILLAQHFFHTPVVFIMYTARLGTYY